MTVVATSLLLVMVERLTAEDTNLIPSGDAESADALGFWPGVDEVSPEAAAGGKAGFVLGEKELQVRGEERAPVDLEKSYELSAFVKSHGSTEARIWLGLASYDEDGDRIISTMVNPIPLTDTELVEDCMENDTVIRIKDGSNWRAGKWGLVAFETDPSGGYGDLPNRKLSSMEMESVTEKDGYWEVVMKWPVGVAFRAGTPVRQHESGANYIYCAAVGQVAPFAGQEFRGRVQGVSLTNEPNKFWPGTASVGVAIVKEETPGTEVHIDDIFLRDN